MKSNIIFFLATASITVSCFSTDASTNVKHILLEPSAWMSGMELDSEVAGLVDPEVGTELSIWGGIKKLVLRYISKYGDERKRYFWGLATDGEDSALLQQPQEPEKIEASPTPSVVIIGARASDWPDAISAVFRTETWMIGELYQPEPGATSFEFLGVLNTTDGRRKYLFLSLVA